MVTCVVSSCLDGMNGYGTMDGMNGYELLWHHVLASPPVLLTCDFWLLACLQWEANQGPVVDRLLDMYESIGYLARGAVKANFWKKLPRVDEVKFFAEQLRGWYDAEVASLQELKSKRDAVAEGCKKAKPTPAAEAEL